MSMYNVKPGPDGEEIVTDAFSGFPVPAEEAALVISAMQAEPSTPRVEETENPKPQDTQA